MARLSMLAAGANRRRVLVRLYPIFKILQSQRFIYSTSFLIFFLSLSQPPSTIRTSKRLALLIFVLTIFSPFERYL